MSHGHGMSETGGNGRPGDRGCEAGAPAAATPCSGQPADGGDGDRETSLGSGATAPGPSTNAVTETP